MASSAGGGQGARRTGPALESMYRFVLWLVPAVEQFPRRQKCLLGDRLQGTALDVLERLVEATYTRDRRRHLAVANRASRSCGSCRLAKGARTECSGHGLGLRDPDVACPLTACTCG